MTTMSPARQGGIHICIPTQEEYQLIIKHISPNLAQRASWHITGLGLMMTTFHLLEIINEYSPARILFAGIAGTYDSTYEVGTVVQVREERLVDFGAEENDGRRIGFHSIVPSISPDSPPWQNGLLKNPYPEIPDITCATGLTIPYASGAEESIERRQRVQAQTESMENAAVFYTCLLKRIRFHLLRGISNHVEIRDRSVWDIAGACRSLAGAISDCALSFS